MRVRNLTASRRWPAALAVVLALAGCSAQDDAKPFVVGTVTYDADLPPEPRLPTADEVCETVEAHDAYVTRPDGALPPEADPSPAGAGVVADPAVVNPDQARIQLALDRCGAAVDAEVGATIAAADAIATLEQIRAAVPNVNISGASGEELAKPQYRASKYAVRLAVSSTGPGNAFISGPLTLPSGVTLWIDEGVTLFATRDAMAFNAAGKFCANTAVSSSKAGSSGNCRALINGDNLVNSAVMGDGNIDSRAYAEIVTTNRLYPLMKVDLTCSNTYTAFASNPPAQAPDGTACDDGGTVVNSKSSARNMTWWDLAYLGNMVENGRTGFGSQSNFRMMVFNFAKNLTLYRIRLNNSANFHFVPAGVDGLTVWGVKLQTPSRAAYANPAGNSNPLYTGAIFDKDNVKNTDAFDPAATAAPASVPLTTGSATTSADPISFDGYLKNVVVAFNYVSTGDDDIVLKGSNNPGPKDSAGLPLLPAIDGNRDVRADRRWGVMIAHNHIYWGHGISIGSETNAGVTNVHVYDNSFVESEEALRIKSDYARGGEVSNVFYENICIKDAENALLFTPYYSTKALTVSGGVATPRYPNFHDISLKNVRIRGSAQVRLEGFQANTGGFPNPQYPLVMTLSGVVADTPDAVSLVSSDADLTLDRVNLPILGSSDARVVVNGAATRSVDPARTVDCSRAFVDFPSPTSPDGVTW
ncbi:MAG TPA: glycosyl hydrolase family 28 protein [Anaeromyxobacteraceae bacterium]|nr:glycosyl hydrolase family 28 protein [Anaeromyxobacteraceae bacterium]